ncbi:class II aldolase/adducin family protein [candidate division KSB1 bacterium]|nr:class II aldolase/adducin family protein [candidate division KSB1 bacterium]
MSNEWQIKQLIIDIGKRLWQREFIAANDGNITVRIDDNRLLTTPTGVSKGFMTPDMIIEMDMGGKILSQTKHYRPSSEVKMHIEVYKQREDIRSVVHAHPPVCTSFAVAGIPLNKCVLPEAVLTLGAVPIAPYGTPSTMEIPDSIKPYLQNSDAILLANHGALTLGTDLINAYHRMETLEHSAKIVFTAIQLGNVNMIPGPEVEKLMELREKLNIPGRVSMCAENGSCENQQSASPNDDQIAEITKLVMERLKKS